MTRKTTDDPAASNHAVEFITDRTVSAHDAADVVGLFETAEFETVTAKVGGQPLELRRVVLTGPWEPVRK
jgi:hypothetical protein